MTPTPPTMAASPDPGRTDKGSSPGKIAATHQGTHAALVSVMECQIIGLHDRSHYGDAMVHAARLGSIERVSASYRKPRFSSTTARS